MSSRQTKVLDGTIQVPVFMQTLYTKIMKGLETGAVAIDVYRPEEKRTLLQNSKQWPMLTDIAEQLVWCGEKLTPEEWKILLCNEFKPQKIMPGISGGFVAFNFRTSKATKSEMCDVIEIYYAYGAGHGVKWSEKSLAQYETYRQAAQ